MLLLVVVLRLSLEAQRTCELMWLKRVLEKLKIDFYSYIKLYYDNQATIKIAHDLVHYDQTKHVEIDKHFIKEKIESGIICTFYVSTKKQVVDVLTKGLPRQRFKDMVNKLGMINIYSPA